MDATITSADGITRCGWAHSAAEMLPYHDDEWGRPLHGDQPLFEKLCLETFQSGLSWITILRKREAFRAAFASFDIDRVASFDDSDVERLLSDARIVRNRAKITASIENARATKTLVDAQPGALDDLLWGFAPPRRTVAPVSYASIPASTPFSAAASVALKKLGYRFVGPTTIYALMQYAGLVNDHAAGCHLAVGEPGAL
ncbi:DNA-3-methyladenine glycosylase I [Agreia sp. VKM Ac-1783]|uniref:DNA-3-methyladenine glycosylase I n=1 Tax=Agreia sp. VKM Ac-1783 TaxID=1938889 RepID=UPI000A2ABF19|nr:DNA-3-methyladenine glycosylase I [Agreia sp. VKM Ac-1783]SMQ63639.1 DNA-3-methyladenine glycosylase I [Agreia sp. VKM Ac-1783]